MSDINFDKKEDLFDQAKKSLKKFKSDIPTGDNVSGSKAAVKLEPAFVATTQEEALATSAGLNQSGCSCSIVVVTEDLRILKYNMILVEPSKGMNTQGQ